MSRHDASVQTAARHARRAEVSGRARFHFDFIWNYHKKNHDKQCCNKNSCFYNNCVSLKKRLCATANWNTKWNKQHEANTKTPARNAFHIDFNGCRSRKYGRKTFKKHLSNAFIHIEITPIANCPSRLTGMTLVRQQGGASHSATLYTCPKSRPSCATGTN